MNTGQTINVDYTYGFTFVYDYAYRYTYIRRPTCERTICSTDEPTCKALT